MPKVIDLPTSTSMSTSDYFIMEASGGGTKKITNNNVLSNRAYTASLSVNNYQSVLTALPVATCGVYTVTADVTNVFSKGDVSYTGLLVARKVSTDTIDYMLSVAATYRPLYSGRVSGWGTSSQAFTVYKMQGTAVN